MTHLLLALSLTLNALAFGDPSGAPARSAEDQVKVFILAGQSNMEGHGQLQSLAHLGQHAEHGELLAHLEGA